MISLSKPPFSSGISYSLLIVYFILYGTQYIVNQTDKKYNPIKVYSDAIYFSIFMRGLPMLPWLMIAIYSPWISQTSPASPSKASRHCTGPPARAAPRWRRSWSRRGPRWRRPPATAPWFMGAMGPWSHWDDNISSIIGNDSKLSSYYCNMV